MYQTNSNQYNIKIQFWAKDTEWNECDYFILLMGIHKRNRKSYKCLCAK